MPGIRPRSFAELGGSDGSLRSPRFRFRSGVVVAVGGENSIVFVVKKHSSSGGLGLELRPPIASPTGALRRERSGFQNRSVVAGEGSLIL